MTITPFLMFEGAAEEAINYYASTFPSSEVLHLQRWAAGSEGKEGQIQLARIRLQNQEILFTDDPYNHAFTFTPSTSLFVALETAEEIQQIYTRLLAGGKALMELGDHGIGQQFAWVEDRFGVSWQLQLP